MHTNRKYAIGRLCAGLAVTALTVAGAAAVASAQMGAAPPPIMPRSAWGAKPAVTEIMKPQTPREIVVHHTSLKQPKVSLKRKLRTLQRFSQSPGALNGRPKVAWGDIPYHFYIDSAGRIGEGRDTAYAGDTNTSYSTANRIQIVVEGHFDKEEPAPAQLEALDRLVVWLAGHYRISPDGISGHSDHVTTECPGKHLKTYLPTLREKVAKAVAR